MRGYGCPIALALVCALSACSSTLPNTAPTQADAGAKAYWENPDWQSLLLGDIQSVVHQPTDTDKTPITGVNGMVRFTLDGSAIKDPQIVASTGYSDLDKLMLQQVMSAKPPETRGPHASEPHEFELLLDMLTPLDWLQYNVYRAIDYRKVYPKDPIIKGDTGNTTVDFDYLDGKANNIAMTGSSKNRDLDKAAVGAVTRAVLPPAPMTYTGKPIHVEVIVCYTLFLSPPDTTVNPCPTEKNVIVVRGTRIKRTTVETSFGGYR